MRAPHGGDGPGSAGALPNGSRVTAGGTESGFPPNVYRRFTLPPRWAAGEGRLVTIPVCYGGDFGPDLPFVLLGNSFLSHFKMERSNDMMRLERTR